MQKVWGGIPFAGMVLEEIIGGAMRPGKQGAEGAEWRASKV